MTAYFASVVESIEAAKGTGNAKIEDALWGWHRDILKYPELMMAHIRRFLPSLFFRLARKIDPA